MAENVGIYGQIHDATGRRMESIWILAPDQLDRAIRLLDLDEVIGWMNILGSSSAPEELNTKTC